MLHCLPIQKPVNTCRLQVSECRDLRYLSRAGSLNCYLIYRTADYFDPKSAPIIGVTRAPDTTYVDLHVEPGSYHYAVRAVSVAGAKSDFSKELPVQVPR